MSPSALDSPGRSRVLVLLAVSGFCASSPPAWFPGAGWLVLLGLGALYRLARRSAHPYRHGYAVGLCQVLYFSWSLRHVTGFGYVAIGLLGAVYFALIVRWTRAAGRLAPLGFALGVGATAWLRSHAPEISYPHGQPGHALYLWPALLGAARFGGEVLVNLLVAGLAAGLAELAEAGGRRRGAFAVGLAAGLGGLLALLRPPAPPAAEGPANLRVAALQSDFPRGFERDGDGLRRLAEATAALAATGGEPVELVLWPESTWPVRLEGEEPRLSRRLTPPIPAGSALCAGTLWTAPDGRRAVAVLLGADGALLGWHEKRVSVPGGERVPFVAWLPEALRGPALDAFEGWIGFRPDQLDGRRRPPLRTPGGVPFAALTCFDNAFAWVTREAVADGARLLAVLSNESWYRQGAELEQMLAMSVLRALETGTPLVRSTVDGVTCVVDADGRITAALPRAPGAGPEALVATVRLGPGRATAAAFGAPATAALCLLSGLVLLRGLRRRGPGAGPESQP
jgi:apolipoprotein N-acyltransferase